MTEIPAEIRGLLACPRCGGALRGAARGGEEWLVCDACVLAYPVEEGIPVLLGERARPWTQA